MQLQLTFLLAAFGTASSSKNPIPMKSVNEISATSKAGNKLLPKSSHRILNNNNEADYSWIAGYSIKFDKCHSFYGYNGGGDQEGGGDNADGESSRLYTQRLVTYRLCPYGSCSGSCSNGGEYIVGMRDFVELYTETRLEMEQYNCEMVAENCACDDDADNCEAQCYADAGLDYCDEEEEDEYEEQFDLQEYLECRELEMQNNNNNNNNNNNQVQYYVGPYCSEDGYSILLGVFTDASCSTPAPEGIYESNNYYGNALPYSTAKQPVVNHDCIKCEVENQDNDNNNNNNNNNGDEEEEVEINEMCAELYEQAGKCETDLGHNKYAITEACNYIHNIIPSLEKVYSSNGTRGISATVFAWVFAFSTLGLAVLAFVLIKQQKPPKVDLAKSDGEIA